MKQLRLTSIILLVLYIGFLFLPYLKIGENGYNGFYDEIVFLSGINFIVPVLTLALIIPYLFLTMREFSKRKRIWLIVFGSLILLKCVFDFFFVKIRYLFTPNFIGIGFYLNLFVGFLFFVLSLVSLWIKTRKVNNDLLDSF